MIIAIMDCAIAIIDYDIAIMDYDIVMIDYIIGLLYVRRSSTYIIIYAHGQT